MHVVESKKTRCVKSKKTRCDCPLEFRSNKFRFNKDKETKNQTKKQRQFLIIVCPFANINAMSRQWREIGLLTKGTGPADGRAATYRCRGGGLTELYSVGGPLIQDRLT